MSVVCIGGPGYWLYPFVQADPNITTSLFFLGYTVLWVGALLGCQHYRSRSDYEFGIFAFPLNPTDRVRHKVNQLHFFLGILLLPVHMVYETWAVLFAVEQ